VVSGDPAQEFDRVVTPFQLPDGRLVVPLAGPGEIRIFDGRGEHAATLGRRGEGPGEWIDLQAAWARGDTIEAFDPDLLRVTRFLPDGRVEVVGLDAVPGAQVAVPGAPAHGWVLTGVVDAGPGRRDQVAFHRFARDGTHLQEVVRLEGMARHRTEHTTGPDPLSPKTVAALGGSRLYVGETSTPTLQVYGPDGALERVVRWVPDRTIDAETAYRTVIDEAVRRAGPERGPATRLRLEAFPRSGAVSVFWAALADPHDFLWIRPYDPLRHSLELAGYGSPGPGGPWLVISPDGAPLTPVEIPPDLEPTQVTGSGLVGIRRDGLGVESVCTYSLERRRE
jgi:hypothetical protein